MSAFQVGNFLATVNGNVAKHSQRATAAAMHTQEVQSQQRIRDARDVQRPADMLDDMKCKFALIGLAYTFRKHLEAGDSELSIGSFQQGTTKLGMQYNFSDIKNFFDACSTGGSRDHVGILRLSELLSGTPGSSWSDVVRFVDARSPSEASRLHTHQAFDTSSSPLGSPAKISSPLARPPKFHDEQAYKVEPFNITSSTGFQAQHFPAPTQAPSEDGSGAHALSQWRQPLPQAPPEDTDSRQDEMPDAPPERDRHGKLPLADTTEAPPEDDETQLAPEETDPISSSGDMPEAPAEKVSVAFGGAKPKMQSSFSQPLFSSGHGARNSGASGGQGDSMFVTDANRLSQQPPLSAMQQGRVQLPGPTPLRPAGRGEFGGDFQLPGWIQDSDNSMSAFEAQQMQTQAVQTRIHRLEDSLSELRQHMVPPPRAGSALSVGGHYQTFGMGGLRSMAMDGSLSPTPWHTREGW